MTAARVVGGSSAAARLSYDRADGATVSADPSSRGPVVVLAPAYCGGSILRSLLEDHSDLACTSGTGLLPLCDQAMETWRKADRRLDGPPSSLASATTRAMSASVITAILAREGKRRWCEVAAANPLAAKTFLHLYPQTRFLCLYRACPSVIRAILDANPWGLADPVFAPFTSKYPANTVTSLTAYWVTATASLLAFEQEHARSCLRVRVEDLSEGSQAEEQITSFLGLTKMAGRRMPARLHEPTLTSLRMESTTDFPASLMPPALLAQANELSRQLDYPPIAADQG